jgi:hypothetical protein
MMTPRRLQMVLAVSERGSRTDRPGAEPPPRGMFRLPELLPGFRTQIPGFMESYRWGIMLVGAMWIWANSSQRVGVGPA